jgi:GNAT superfamily N-acetyltransferase
MVTKHGDYELDDDRSRVNFSRVHRWLDGTYWAAGRTRQRVEKSAEFSSLVVGAYARDGTQIGFLRVVSDRVTFAWVADVFVDDPHRGKGIARAMVRFALDHPDHREVRRWVLRTRDAHGVYATLGFEPYAEPEGFMQFAPKAPDGSPRWT